DILETAFLLTESDRATAVCHYRTTEIIWIGTPAAFPGSSRGEARRPPPASSGAIPPKIPAEQLRAAALNPVRP
ncbi:MAG TPA: hypothetical protein VK973_15170, partial [Arenicellales bacterium]|nr:hypothetical protein [Arenicellales bacterium]